MTKKLSIEIPIEHRCAICGKPVKVRELSEEHSIETGVNFFIVPCEPCSAAEYDKGFWDANEIAAKEED